ncbi:glycosyltransferase family 4 protein [Mucilaginibacter daejeonensis]|uniref:glycosyltransferase family 4 protein n=1 Tax=Mucilaginibacter daejeonensis TaxID=398049 RepID=UPI001D173BFA|nr:glycosyltransferase family 4 protein [Mucilaginibacter daejeonensis]UEG53275.1 glycosyltransferase family 4 protein [Mucilaginibacter daejeonensis]
MNILIVTHLAPFPQNSGYPIVVGNTIRGLVDTGHQVSLCSLDPHPHKDHEDHTDELISRIKYQRHTIDTSISATQAFLSLFNGKLYTIDRYYDSQIEHALIKEVAAGNYDIIQFEGLYVTPYLAAVRKSTKAKVIYRAHHIEYLVWERLAKQKNDPAKKFYLNLIAKRIRLYETKQFDLFDAVAVFTDQDKECIKGHCNKQLSVEILPVGLDLERYRPDHKRTEFPSLFFLGAMDWMPNREGIEWFLENFSNELVNGDLRTRFYVAGNDIPERFDDYEVVGKIFIHGEVDDALEFVNSKAIMIVPLLSGGGMRVKIVEGMAMQKCIISTSLGAEGINYSNGENILIANTPQEFHRAIKRCITDENYCRRIGRNARALVEEQHETHKISQRLADFYQRTLLAGS